jgi:hypothetical protein
MKQRTLKEIADFFGAKAKPNDSTVLEGFTGVIVYEDNKDRCMSILDSAGFIKKEDK